MLTLLDIIQEIARLGKITPELGQELDILLWSRSFDDSEISILRQLDQWISSGLVQVD
ncbi:hypothetical protein K4A83_03200 [Spirulina subsalsa FACHB-351]|uniref:Uncharacterized protein n=1 Tax=Spirulina subsalsa FACHB-351 TaxID=234711 RepID=A0ABT3L1C6_9CYAN|nr:hypothetical protein [Spirulina subsalsa]MCW6035281.1 hypothetical protein [Spirulina subsalsa FACHB-351]